MKFFSALEKNKFLSFLLVLIWSLYFILIYKIFLIPLTKAQPQVTLFFDPSPLEVSGPASATLKINSGQEQIAFVRISVDFDKTKVNLSQDIVLSNVFKNVISKTSIAEANASGNFQIVAALSVEDRKNPPAGIIDVATLNFIPVVDAPNQEVDLVFDNENIQIVDINASELPFTGNSGILILNPQPSPTPFLTPTPTISQGTISYATLSFDSNPFAFLGDEFPLTINFASTQEVSGVDVVVLFDPDILSANRVEPVSLFSENTNWKIENDLGLVRISQTADPRLGFSGEGTLAKIFFNPKHTGTTTFVFDYREGSKSESNAISLSTGDDILSIPHSHQIEVSEHARLNLTFKTSSENPNLGHFINAIISKSTNWQYPITSNSQGVVENIPLEDSDIGKMTSFYLDADGYLRRAFSLFVNPGLNTIDIGKLIAGDLNNDGVINTVDLGLMYADWFGNGLADFNKDGIVNSADHWILTSNFFLEDEN